jgi:hypothetical protein
MSSIKKTCLILLINFTVLITFFLVIEIGFNVTERFTQSHTKHLSHKEFRLNRPEPYSESSYFSQDFINESFSQPGGWITPIGTRILLPKNFKGHWINVRENKRVTIDQPKIYKKRILIFGGSTIYSGEVPDSFTIASQLQEKLISKGYIDILVENYGATSIHISQQFERLQYDVELNASDAVIFYDGVNDVLQRVYFNNPNGFIANEAAKSPLLVQYIRKWKEYSAFLRWVDENLISQKNYRLNLLRAPEAANEYVAEIVKANSFVNSKGAKFLHFLQPNIFTRIPKNSYEKNLIGLEGSDMMPYGLKEVFESTYPIIQKKLETITYSRDATSLFNGLIISPYMDFCHVSESANKAVANEIFLQLLKMGVLNNA